jgi:hypothetical protein
MSEDWKNLSLEKKKVFLLILEISKHVYIVC